MKDEEERLIDSLLTEHAKTGVGADEHFLKELEKALGVEQPMPAANQTSTNWPLRIGMGAAAAVTIGAVTIYGLTQPSRDEKNNLALDDASLSHSIQVNPAKPNVGESRLIAEPEQTTQVQKASPAVEPIVEDTLQADKISKTKRNAATTYLGDALLHSAKNSHSLKPHTSEKACARKRAAYEFNGANAPTTGPTRIKRSYSPKVAKISGCASGGGWDDQAVVMQLTDKPLKLNNPTPRALASPASLNRPELSAPTSAYRKNKQYDTLTSNPFRSPIEAPLSTFSVDVDTASYTNLRRMILSHTPIQADAVRIEEMINYFDYDYPQPKGDHPFSINIEQTTSPWIKGNKLVKIGLQAKKVVRDKRPAANLVFLLNVSDSMNAANKLPLLKRSIDALLEDLTETDTVSIVVYAGSEGVALPPTVVDAAGKKKITSALSRLRAGGSTAGGAGIKLAYKLAQQQFKKDSVNRVILATDGDLNVGTTNLKELTQLAQGKAKNGIHLSVLGFGASNFNDTMLESIIIHGGGNFFNIDTYKKARKVLLEDMVGTLTTIGKDVGLQIEFNPATVKSYRLIGYANRILMKEGSANAKLDADSIGSGYSVTAIYEIVPANSAKKLRYQPHREEEIKRHQFVHKDELMLVKLRYKQPDAKPRADSTYFDTVVKNQDAPLEKASQDMKFASSVALFGMLLRDSNYKGMGDMKLASELAKQGLGADPDGRRKEFLELVQKVQNQE